MALGPVGLESILIRDIIIIIVVIIFIVIFFFSVASVLMGLVSILNRNTLLLIFLLLLFSAASVYVPHDVMLILTGHNFALILVLMAVAPVAPVAGEGVPMLCRIVPVLIPVAALCEGLLIGDILLSSLVAWEPVTVFPGDTLVLFSVVSGAPERRPAVRENILALIAVASVAVDGVAKLT